MSKFWPIAFDISPRMDATRYISKNGKRLGIEFGKLTGPEPWVVYRMCVFNRRTSRFFDLVLGRRYDH